MPALVFDLGGTYLRSGVSDARGHLLRTEKKRVETFVQGYDAATTWQRLRRHIESFASQNSVLVGSDAAIVLAFPGPIDKRDAQQRIQDAPTLIGGPTDIPDLAGQLQTATGRQVHLLNDVSAAAWHFSRVVSARRFLVVTVSSGIGSKIFDRDHPLGVIDSPPHSGEIGHFVVDDSPDAPLCDCGGRGHLGAIASGRGIERFARRSALGNPDAAILTNECHLVPAALAGDTWVLDIVRTCTRPLARTLLAVTMAAGLDRVIVIGGFALQLGDVYLSILRSLITELSGYKVCAAQLEQLVHLSDPSEEVGLLGAAAYACQLRINPTIHSDLTNFSDFDSEPRSKGAQRTPSW
jgi:glucokinase